MHAALGQPSSVQSVSFSPVTLGVVQAPSDSQIVEISPTLLRDTLTIHRPHVPHQSSRSVSNLTSSRLSRLHAVVCFENSYLRRRKRVTLQKAGGTDKSVRVLVVDDYEPWQRFASTTLGKQPELEVVGNVSDGLEAVQQAQQLQPDLILLDIGLPTLNGIEAARRIREVSPTSKILFVSENRSVDVAEEALRTVAGGYVVKSDAASELLPAVKAVLEGKHFVSASLSGHGLAHPTHQHTTG